MSEFTDEDMADVGRALMKAIEVHAPDGWHPSDCPSEIVGDLMHECLTSEAALTAANEQIRKLESWQETVRDYSLLANKLGKLEAQLTAEREVSDKLVAALEACRLHMYEHASNTPDGAFDTLCSALAEVAALRRGEKQ